MSPAQPASHIGLLTRGFRAERIAVARLPDMRPNEWLLSCGALKKDSFHNLRAPASFKRLLDSTRTGPRPQHLLVPRSRNPVEFIEHISTMIEPNLLHRGWPISVCKLLVA